MIAEIDEMVNTLIGEQEPGVAVAVVKSGQLVHGKGYGLANLEWNIPVQPDTVFRLASLTKQFTATAILLLEQQGRLRTDEPLTHFLPNYPTHGHSISVAHLLTHTSGISPYNEVDNFFELYARKRLSYADVLNLIQNLPLEFEPGTRYKYNNSGYYLLGMIIEAVAGRSYENFLQEQVFTPLGMKHSYYLWNEALISQRAGGYIKTEHGYQNAPFLDMTVPYAGGALGSTLNDLVRWDAALDQGHLLNKEILERMHTPAQLRDGRTTEYGFGWGIGDYRGHRVAYHQGEINGFISFLARFLDDAVTVILLSNSNGRDVEILCRRIIRQVLEIPPLNHKITHLELHDLKMMIGTYTLGKLFKCVVQQTENKIILHPFNVELKPIQKTMCCFAHDHEIEVRFSDQEDQTFRTMTIHFPFSPLTLTRQRLN